MIDVFDDQTTDHDTRIDDEIHHYSPLELGRFRFGRTLGISRAGTAPAAGRG